MHVLVFINYWTEKCTVKHWNCCVSCREDSRVINLDIWWPWVTSFQAFYGKANIYYRVYQIQSFVQSRATLIQYTPSSSISLQCTLISSCSRIPSLPSGLILYVLPRNIPASKYPFPRVPHPILLDFITLISFFEKSLFVRFSSLSYPNFFRRIKYHSEYPILDKQKEYIYIYILSEP